MKPSGSFVLSAASWKGIWGARVPERVKHPIWRIKHSAIASKLNLSIKHITRDTVCPIYKQDEETTEHLFLLCPWTTPLWYGLQVFRVPTTSNITNMARWWRTLLKMKISQTLRTFFPLLQCFMLYGSYGNPQTF